MLDFLRCLLDIVEPGDKCVIELCVSSTLDYIHPLLMGYVPRKSKDFLSHQQYSANSSSSGCVPNGLDNSL